MCRGVAQPGSVSALGAGGRWFESNHPDHSCINSLVLILKSNCTDTISSDKVVQKGLP